MHVPAVQVLRHRIQKRCVMRLHSPHHPLCRMCVCVLFPPMYAGVQYPKLVNVLLKFYREWTYRVGECDYATSVQYMVRARYSVWLYVMLACFLEPGTGTAICVRDSLRGTVQNWGGQTRITWLTTSSTLFISVYMPDCNKDYGEYSDTTDSIININRQQRGENRFRQKVVLGGDLNIMMPHGLEGVTVHAVPEGRRHGTSPESIAQRQECWLRICLPIGLEFCTTHIALNRSPELFDRGFDTWRGHHGARGQLDHILCDTGGCSPWGSGMPAFRSDHAILWATFKA